MIYNPLEQFELHYLLMIINNFNYVLLLTLLLYLLIAPSLIVDLINDLTDGLSIKNYESFIFMIFLLLLITNMLGLFGLAINAQLVYSIGLSTGIIIGCTILGIKLHGMNFFLLFLPNGAPLGILIVLFFIELLSYCSRAVSLGLRLGANTLSGHLLVDIVATLIYAFGTLSIILAVVGTALFGLLVAIQLLEIAIALIQVYVFSILTVNYLKDVVDLH